MHNSAPPSSGNPCPRWHSLVQRDHTGWHLLVYFTHKMSRNILCVIFLVLCAANTGYARRAQKPPYPVMPAAFSAVAVLDVNKAGPIIPQSFMGFSHEWPYIEEMYDIPQYVDVIKLLQSYGSGPLSLRIGGGSTDLQKTVPTSAVWNTLSKLHKDTGMQYIIGLNFFDQDVTLARKQMDAAQKGLPAESIQSFEIGNEPDYYANKPSTHWNGTKLVASFNDYISCCFHTEWYNMAEALSCRNGPDSCTLYQFTGPVWGHLNLRTTTIDWFLKTNAKWVKMTSVHWYKATAEKATTAASLLDEGQIRSEMENLKKIVEVSNSYGKPLRVAEMNTISNSGRQGVSDVFAAALWTLDASFEVAQAGGVGVNFHQGAGQNLYAAIIRWYDSNNKLLPPQLRPPFYGMLMFQQAVRGGSRLMAQGGLQDAKNGADTVLKVWPLMDVNTKELRWVVINKDPSKAGSVTLRVSNGGGYAPSATVSRLLATGSNPLSVNATISLGGITYGDGIAKSGKETTETLPAAKGGAGLDFTLYVPPASAALVRLPKQ